MCSYVYGVFKTNFSLSVLNPLVLLCGFLLYMILLLNLSRSDAFVSYKASSLLPQRFVSVFTAIFVYQIKRLLRSF